MPYVKELILKGFKSFARETKIPFKRNMNVIIGPNGSGKSNITDGICFVLGKLGTKSMRASRLANLIFSGTKNYKPAQEASVELIFDNSDKGFSLDNKEVSIKRIIRRNGQTVYKINDETKTRQEVIELLAQAGIDPKGFNLILQGQIEGFVKMHPEERRKVIEEVAGISIYEIRKEKSIKELEKTDERLRQVSAILKERSAYLKTLEEERKQALRYNHLKEMLKRFKASILNKNLQEKQSLLQSINDEISKKQEQADKIKLDISKAQDEISSLNEKISHITSHIQKQSGLEQEQLNQELSDLRAEIAGISTRKQHYETQLSDLEVRKKEFSQSIETTEKEIHELKKTKGKSSKKELELKKQELEKIEEAKRRLYILKSNLSSINSLTENKKQQLQKLKNESDFTLTQIESLESTLNTKEGLDKQNTILKNIKISFIEIKKDISAYEKEKTECEKIILVSEKGMEQAEKIKKQVQELDICPLCKTKITKEHSAEVMENENKKISALEKAVSSAKEKLGQAEESAKKSEQETENLEKEKTMREQDIITLSNIINKKQYLKKLSENEEEASKEIHELLARKKSIETKISAIKTSEEKYDSLRLEVQELERREEKSLGMEAALKQRELERIRVILKQVQRDEEETTQELEEITNDLEEKQSSAEEKEEQEKSLRIKFKKIIDDKNKLQDKIRFFESHILKKQNEKSLIEQESNNKKIERAQINAQKESIEEDAKEYEATELVKLPLQQLKEKLEKTQRIIDNIGTVNLKALEVYDGIKKQYDSIEEKVNKLQEEKQEILKIIEDIDKKKRKTFVTTLKSINELFERNFSQLSTKGRASLIPENQEEIFSAGLDIIIKVGKGKYFDIHSLSGGEQTLVALSLIFAIQEHSPYCFYIFDEIDAALDKRNSEKLAVLLKKYLKEGQYIIITHNDALISESSTLYGVSMHEGVSKVLSLEI